MANTVQIKRGNNTSVNAHTGPSGELIYNLDTGRLHAQDGSTAGGKPHALISDVDLKANAAVNIIAGAGLTGGGTLAASRTLALNSTSIASLAKADTAVQPAIAITAGTGLTGGGNLTANRTVALNAASISSLGKADTALQAPGGSTGQILAKSSNTTNDVAWVSSEAATAVSYGPQTLTEAQQVQARQNIQADKSYDSIASVAAATVPAFANAIRTNGYYAAGDGGGALYKRAASEPSHAGKLQSADGAWWEIAESVISPRMFGAKGDGATDDTVALQGAMSLDQPLFIDGHFLISDACNYDRSGTKRIFGNGDTSSSIIMASAAGHGLSKTSGALIVESIGVTTLVDKNSSTAAIFIGGAFSGRDLVDNCRIYGQSETVRLAMGIHVESDVIPTIRSNYILNCRDYGVLLQNIHNGAGSEAVVTANTFNTGDASNSATAIAWTSGQGAVRISDNIIQSYLIGVQLRPDLTVIKSSAIISSNSFENNGFVSISISRPSGGGSIQAVNIVGNDFQNFTGRHLLVQDTDGDNLSFVRYINLTGNTHVFGITAAVQITAGVIFSMDGGVFETFLPGLTPVVLAANAPMTGQIGSNVFYGSGITPYQLNGNAGITKVSTAPA